MYEDIYEEKIIRGEPLPFQLPGWIACAPFEEYLGMKIEEAREGKALLSMPFQAKLAQGKGLMHGGAITALADTAVAMAIKSLLPEGTHFVTMSLALKFHAPVTGGTVRAVATTSMKDERTIEGVAEVFDENDVKAATFTSLFRVKRGG
ncbi:PaaI family thioesterase [Geomonas sp. RF6]|uniref:PaaI family thioesterase n=1 Tax=Geomonas sp. RF6 TaxID=2897342 RepID=UPI001E61B172|nr:PaaI family thioesterase [Geomonas sp. RF6]UFS70155.1 PaaI family thioesterase [Geomonas sp. RF6]